MGPRLASCNWCAFIYYYFIFIAVIALPNLGVYSQVPAANSPPTLEDFPPLATTNTDQPSTTSRPAAPVSIAAPAQTPTSPPSPPQATAALPPTATSTTSTTTTQAPTTTTPPSPSTTQVSQPNNSFQPANINNNNVFVSTRAPTQTPEIRAITSNRLPEPRRIADTQMNGSVTSLLVGPQAATPTSRQSGQLNSLRSPTAGPNTATANNSSPNIQFLRPRKFRCNLDGDCLNEGRCINGACFCSPGYTSENCAINVNECRLGEETPCYNEGTCVDEINAFRCICAPGFKGERCQEAIDMCINSPCLNGAKCVNHRTDYSCDCESGWEGRHCEKNIDECQRSPCQNNATCYDLINDYRCDCGNSGFIGKNCELDFDECAAKPCGFAAKECVDLIGDFKCICHEGFTGKRCDIDIDECLTHPCENNGICRQKSLNIHSLNSSLDLSENHELRGHEDLNSTANISQYAGFICECKEEFYGDRCEERKKCYTKSVLELCNDKRAECVNVGSSYECLINASFDGSGQKYATYKVNGDFKMKEILIKYRSLSGGTLLSFETNHTDSSNSNLYLNKSGLYLDEHSIYEYMSEEFTDGSEREIRLNFDNPLEIKTLTLSRNLASEFHAPFKGCLMQLRLNNQLVPLVDYEAALNHSNFEMLSNHLEVGQCRTCFEKDCMNEGHCEFQDGFEHCACPESFTGNYCETDVNECEKGFNLCLNGATCENLHGSYRCNCREGWRGEKCQDVSDFCKAKQPCQAGTCKNVNGAQPAYQCECPSSHIGKKCERRRDCHNECHNHHAHCVNNVTCACLPGRREDRIMCEYVSSCEQVEGELCLNGGICKNIEGGGYHCHCQDPFYGPICQFIIEKPQFDLVLLIVVTCVGFLLAACAVVSLVIFRSVRKARATRGTYSPSTQEKFGNPASDLLKPPQPERLI